MPLDGPGAEEELGADPSVGVSGEGETRDVLLLRGQVVAGVVAALADGLAGREQLVPGAFSERVRAAGVEYLVGAAQVLARVRAAALAAQPLSIEQVPARELEAQARP